MIDTNGLLNDPQAVKDAVLARGEDTTPIDRALELGLKLRQLETEYNSTRAAIKSISKEVAQSTEAPADQLEQLKASSKELGKKDELLKGQVSQLKADLKEILLRIPNLPSPDCPVGKSSADNKVLSTPADFDAKDFAPHQKVPHWEFAVEMGILDLHRAVKLSGSMFAMVRGAGARLSNALIQLALERNRDLYEEIRPPSLVLSATLEATGHLPKFADEAYMIERDGLWAVPTGEVPLTSLMADEVLDAADLPMRLMAYTPCYRREAGTHGKQTRGMLRLHEFDKVEILAYATAEQAPELHQEILERAIGMVKDLSLIHRVVDICTGDLGASSARTFDVEVFAPGTSSWLECSSVSWFRDYQARRANIRYRNPETKKNQFIHTLNGSALAVPRVWAALVETHRQSDGSIKIPEVLKPYMGGLDFISA